MQIWAFRLHHPARLLAAVALFQTSEGEDDPLGAPRGGGLSLGGERQLSTSQPISGGIP